ARNDIAIVTLPDPDYRMPGYVMIAPFAAGTRYGLYDQEPIVPEALNFAIVGYGKTGTGVEGIQDDRVERISIPNADPNGVFTLAIDGQPPIAISQNA